MRWNNAITSTSAFGGGASGRPRLLACVVGRAIAPSRGVDRAHRARHDVQLREALVEVGVDRADVGNPDLVHLLQHLQLDARVGLDLAQRVRERVDDRRRRERVAVGLEIGTLHQVADAAVQERQFLVAGVLDHPLQVAGDHRLVHRRGLDERQVGKVGLRKVGLVALVLAGQPLVDAAAHALLEVRQQRRPLRPHDVAGVHEQLLLLADVGAARAVHQHVADLVENGRERTLHALHGQVPALVQDPVRFTRGRAAGSGGRGGRVHAESGARRRAAHQQRVGRRVNALAHFLAKLL